MAEYRRILLDDTPTRVRREGDDLVTADGRRVSIAAAVHLPPTEPSKILAVHLNYRSRVEEFMTRLPPAPTYFQKPLSALNAHQGEVVRPDRCRFLNFEGEIAIVIGTRCKGISPDEAMGHVEGFTIANDFGLHDFRDTDAGSMLRVKGSDGLCPLGPGVVTGWDHRGKTIRTLVNGSLRQQGNTSEMEWDMAYLVADLARTITLLPGDVVTVEVEGLGSLTNTVVSGSPVRDDVGAQPSASEEVVSTSLGGDWEHRGVRAPASPGGRPPRSERG